MGLSASGAAEARQRLCENLPAAAMAIPGSGLSSLNDAVWAIPCDTLKDARRGRHRAERVAYQDLFRERGRTCEEETDRSESRRPIGRRDSSPI